MDQTRLVGRWLEEENRWLVSKVAYTISIRAGHFHVCGIDESDGTRLRISNLNWDGDALRFATYYPPTGHHAEHRMQLIRKGRATHRVSYVDEDGRHVIDENWKKVPR